MLEVRSVSKTYLPPPALLRPLIRSAVRQPVHALADVSLTVGAGEIVGLIGPNGAGKTTLIKMVTTLLEQDRGAITIDGYDTVSEPRETRRRTGVVLAEDRGLYWRLSGRQNLELFGVLCGLPQAGARRRADELLELVGLAAVDKLVFGYSAGMRGRLALARALVTRPALLVLDEPTRSLDPVAAHEVGTILRTLADEGHAILFSTHRLNEVTRLSDRIVVIAGGRTTFFGTTDEARLEGARDAEDSLAGMLHGAVAADADRVPASAALSGADRDAFRTWMRRDQLMLTSTRASDVRARAGR